MSERLGRHAFLFHSRCLSCVPGLGEEIVHDHFETFVARQDRALGVGTAVGAQSRFVYDVDPAPHRGSGRRPDRRADTSPRPNQSYVRSIRRTLSCLSSRAPEGRQLILVVDGRGDYRAAVREGGFGGEVTLRVFPNPKRGPKGTPRSALAMARDQAMFPVDQLHQLLRHTCSDHKRETIAFGRRLESILGRAQLMAVWKNFIKARSERAPDRSTPAMGLGLAAAPWRWERVLTRRLFPSREAVSDSALRLFQKRWTSGFPELRLKHAA